MKSPSSGADAWWFKILQNLIHHQVWRIEIQLSACNKKSINIPRACRQFFFPKHKHTRDPLLINPPGVIECPTMRFNVLLIEGRRRSRRYLDLTIMCVTISSAVVFDLPCRSRSSVNRNVCHLSFTMTTKAFALALMESPGHQFEMCIHLSPKWENVKVFLAEKSYNLQRRQVGVGEGIIIRWGRKALST